MAGIPLISTSSISQVPAGGPVSGLPDDFSRETVEHALFSADTISIHHARIQETSRTDRKPAAMEEASGDRVPLPSGEMLKASISTTVVEGRNFDEIQDMVERFRYAAEKVSEKARSHFPRYYRIYNPSVIEDIR